jgi:NADP-dependent 3-hydroxy acid dehydrogenase YdfG
MASATRRTERPVAIVAGGSTGIGASVSRRLDQESYRSDRLAADLAGARRGSTP